MRSRVKRSLGDDSARTNLSAAVHVTQTPDTYRAQVRTHSREGSGERVLENESCEILADSVALVIALSASAPDSSGERGLAIALSAQVTAATGPLPKLALGVGGALAVEGFWSMRLEVGGTYYVAQSTTYEQTNIGARFKVLRLGARGCRLWSVAKFDFAPCFGVQIYRIQGYGFGGMKWSDGTSYLWGPALGVFGRFRLFSALALVLAADVVVPVSRQSFVYTDLDVLHRPASLAFQLFIGPEVQF